MSTASADHRSAQRKSRDEQIAAEPPLPPPDLPPGAAPQPVEQHLLQLFGRPHALLGIVENGLIRPLNGDVRLPEHSRVIIVALRGGDEPKTG